MDRGTRTGRTPMNSAWPPLAVSTGWEPAHDVLALPIEGKTVGNTAGIDLVSPSGTVRRLVTFPTSPPLASQEWVEGAVWSPDGSQLAVSFDDHVFTNGSTTLVAYSVNGGRPTTWLWLKGSNTTLLGMRYVFAFPAGWWEKWGIGFWVTGGGATHNIDQTPLAVIAKPGAAAKVIGQTLSDDPDEALAAGPSGQLAIVDNPTNFSGRLLAENKVLEVCDPKTTTCTPVRASNSIVTSEPAWSPSGDALAFTEAPSTELIDQLGQPGVAAWYAEHKLYVYRPATHSLQGIANASGATAPTWSWNGKSILYVSNDGLWLLPTLSQRPVKIASRFSARQLEQLLRPSRLGRPLQLVVPITGSRRDLALMKPFSCRSRDGLSIHGRPMVLLVSLSANPLRGRLVRP